jgi:hypothetical protein
VTLEVGWIPAHAGMTKKRVLRLLSSTAKSVLSLMIFVLRLDMNLDKDRAKAKGEAIHGHNLLRISSGDEL